MSDGEVVYQFEYENRVRCAFIGAGEHSYRNIFPAFQYAPVDLVAVCDLDSRRAEQYARLFGAAASYTDYREMLREERPEAVFIVTGNDASGRYVATQLAAECMEAGAHVWMEKPTATSIAEVINLIAVSERTGLFAMTGLKKVFTPTVEKAKAIATAPEFGGISSVIVRYPQAMPEFERRRDLHASHDLIDHIFHPVAILNYLAGPAARLTYEWEPSTGGSVTTIRFKSGAVGSLHLVAGIAQTSPHERVEIIGKDANVVIDNGVDLTYYRRAPERLYGRTGSFIVEDSVAPLRWLPEFSLGELHNKNLFLLGYVPEVLHFCNSVLKSTPPEKGTLKDAMEILRYLEAYQTAPPGQAYTFMSEAPTGRVASASGSDHG